MSQFLLLIANIIYAIIYANNTIHANTIYAIIYANYLC